MSATQRSSNREFYSHGTEQASNSSISEGLNPEVKLIGGVYRSTLPTYTNNQNAIAHFGSRGELLTEGSFVSSPIFPNKIVLDCGTFAALTTGATGAHPLFTVTGVVAVSILGICGTDLTVGGATTLEVGTASSTAGLLAQITASNWDANEIWEMTDANLNKLVVDTLLTKKIVTESIILTIGTSTVTGGTAKIYLSWYPISSDGNVAVVSPFA